MLSAIGESAKYHLPEYFFEFSSIVGRRHLQFRIIFITQLIKQFTFYPATLICIGFDGPCKPKLIQRKYIAC